MNRRNFLTASLSASAALAACRANSPTAHITGGFTGVAVERGHAWRDGVAATASGAASGKAFPPPAVTRKTRVLIAGGGIAGLAAARALRLQGIDDFAVLELEDNAGGNSRAAVLGGIPCPQGAHYLPLPGDDAPEVQDLLEELGLRQRVSGRWQYDERHLCHSPQERLFFQGHWQEGLLPVQGVGAATLAQYQRFADLVEQLRHAVRWTLPVQNSALAPVQRALAATSFIAWLDRQQLTDPHLRWYLDYCCRDDYGAGIATVSAWAGIHYFASRHGFHAPGGEAVEREGLLTWPQGNAWLTERLAAPLGTRLHTGCAVLRIASGKHGAQVDAFNTASQTVERWQAERVIVALPIFIAARVVQNPPDFLRQAAQQVFYAPWLVANIHIQKPLHDPPGAPPSWDNVIYDGSTAQGLGYVDASHQSLNPVAGATVLTHYRALGDVPGGAKAGRQSLLEKPWAAWRDQIVAELSHPHPDLAAKATRIDITRYGHAMAIPLPHAAGQIGLYSAPTVGKQLPKREQNPSRFVPTHGPLRFAHSDWANYSVFEEAFTMGHAAAQMIS